MDQFQPTLKPCPNFNAEDDCKKLRAAMKGLGTDEKAIIQILGHRSNDQRLQLVKQFKTMFGKDLIDELKSELSGHFEDLVKALLYPLATFDAMELRGAMEGVGTKESTLVEILCSRNNFQLRAIKDAYVQLYRGRTLEADVESETSGHYKRILVSLLQANRDDDNRVDAQAARKDAQLLFEAGEKMLGTDESTFNMILATRSPAQIRAIISEYAKFAKKDLEDVIKAETSGDLQTAYLAIVRCMRCAPAYFAHELVKAMQGAGTRDSVLIRIVVTRCEIDMELIKQQFYKETGKPLATWIEDDTSGDYKKLLLALIGA